jgi:hypothetical protein
MSKALTATLVALITIIYLPTTVCADATHRARDLGVAFEG